MAYCTACGTGAAPDDRFCTKCGRALCSAEPAREHCVIRKDSTVVAQTVKSRIQKAAYVVYKQWIHEDGACIGWTGKVVVFDLVVYKERRQGHCKKYGSSDPMPSEALERARNLALVTDEGKRIQVFPDGKLQIAVGTNPMDDL